ncbi:MAG: Na(+)/H(+) antiporter subunit B [Rhodospirillaceae bacterium]|nr:Na(+)/H(+) antiporter subunit B [Rhodospirillaceae bacterium]
MRGHLILRVVSKLLIPFLLLFALYVQFHGDFGPGGGFQAGVIVAAAFVLYALIFGLQAAQKIISPALLEVAVPLGVLIYAGVGVLTWSLGGNFLDYGMLDSHDPSHGQHLGILLVEAGVLMTVSSTMLLIFYAFAGRGR